MRAFLKNVNIYAPTRHRVYFLKFLFYHHLPISTPTYPIRKLVHNQYNQYNQYNQCNQCNQCNQSESGAVVL